MSNPLTLRPTRKDANERFATQLSKPVGKITEKAWEEGIMCGDSNTWDKADRKAVGLTSSYWDPKDGRFYSVRTGHSTSQRAAIKLCPKTCKDSFEKPRNLTFDRYLFLTENRRMRKISNKFNVR